jgi:hypothetical protein
MDIERKFQLKKLFFRGPYRNEGLDGRVRYYDLERAASSLRPNRGVVKWNPITGQMRSWYECRNHLGIVNRVHPKTINGQDILGPHYPHTATEMMR